MSTLTEIKTAISQLDARERALLTAELFAFENEPDPLALDAALERGLADVAAGKVHLVEEVREMLPQWLTRF